MFQPDFTSRDDAVRKFNGSIINIDQWPHFLGWSHDYWFVAQPWQGLLNDPPTWGRKNVTICLTNLQDEKGQVREVDDSPALGYTVFGSGGLGFLQQTTARQYSHGLTHRNVAAKVFSGSWDSVPLSSLGNTLNALAPAIVGHWKVPNFREAFVASTSGLPISRGVCVQKSETSPRGLVLHNNVVIGIYDPDSEVVKLVPKFRKLPKLLPELAEIGSLK